MLHDPHEAAVDAFLSAARLADPEKLAVVFAKYPVLSRRKMRTISEIEIPVGLHPEARAGQHYVASATEVELTLLPETA